MKSPVILHSPFLRNLAGTVQHFPISRICWWRLPCSPTKSHEYSSVELSGSVKGLRDLIRTNNPLLVFLAETKCHSSQIEKLKRNFDLFGCSVDSQGKSGGLVLLWQKSVDVQLQSYSRYHIDVSVRLENSEDWWRFSGVYGEPDTSKRTEFWNLLSRLHDQSPRPWLCAGDFNEILEQFEKKGGLYERNGKYAIFGTV
ncbi:UNVERIFIED_CONTAM: hypothetical protein Sradi_0946700 [Sesamum radiatum]|uniref:Endonuclease/exonuclease/phosphatase domain-containing protein n=1 Tax=Sesamum radiatum TaxID=300843 RepID=A0AAW2V3A7_SESRA